MSFSPSHKYTVFAPTIVTCTFNAIYVSTICMDNNAHEKIKYSDAYCMEVTKVLTAIVLSVSGLYNLQTGETKSW